MKLKIYAFSFIAIAILLYASCSKNTKILESLSNSIFYNEYYGDFSLKTFNKKESAFSACFSRDDKSLDIIYPITGNPKLHFKEDSHVIFCDVEIIDENTLRFSTEDGEIQIFKRQTEEDIKNRIKNNIAKYVYIWEYPDEIPYLPEGKIHVTQYIKNETDYTIDEVVYGYKENNEYKKGIEYFIKGNSNRGIKAGYDYEKLQNLEIISVKSRALEIY